MDQLLRLAVCNEKVANHRLAAAITYKNRIISFGFNSHKSSPFQKRFFQEEERIFLHAETAAIKNALRLIDVDLLRYCKLFVCRASLRNHQLNWAMAKPCTGCQKAIAAFDISEVYYTTNDPLVIETL